VPNRAVRPLDADGLLLIRDNAGLELLLGRRRRKARAFPGEYVFPGGLVEAADRQRSGFPESVPAPAAGLDGRTRRDLKVFARAALRECYEETGLLLVAGDRAAPPGDAARRHRVWRAYAEISQVPAFAALLPVARAITPLGYPRRFHSRFFVTVLGVSAGVRPADPGRPLAGDGELEDLGWVPMAETRRLPLAEANAVVLHEILETLRARHGRGAPWPGAPWPGPLAGTAAPCFTWRGAAEHQYRTVIPPRDIRQDIRRQPGRRRRDA
jgi:8-oxo-dGTP pyrophosphatase MutT (NUDIX family)